MVKVGSVTIGIDPGVTGGVAVIYDTKVHGLGIQNVRTYIVPKDDDGNVDVYAFAELISNWNIANTHAYVEDVHSIYGSSASSNFKFGWATGIIEGILCSHGISFSKVQPKKWQKEMFKDIPLLKKPDKISKTGKIIKGKTDTKKMASLSYQKHFPKVNLFLTEKNNVSKNAHDGMVDALLICEWGRRQILSKEGNSNG